MTVSEMTQEVYELSGKLDYLYPYDDNGNVDVTTAGASRILRALNNAQRTVAAWKDRVRPYPRFRFKRFFTETYEATAPLSATTGSGSTVDALELDTSQSDDYYAGYVAKVDGQTRLVVSSSGTTVTLADSLSSAPDNGETVEFYERYLTFTPPSEMVDVLTVVDLAGETELERRHRGDIVTSHESPGTPTSWYRVGSRIYFDRPVDSARYYRIISFALPAPMEASGDEPDLPPQYHWALVVWALAYAFGQSQEPLDRKSYKDEFDMIMRTTQNPQEMGEALIQSFNTRVEMT